MLLDPGAARPDRRAASRTPRRQRLPPRGVSTRALPVSARILAAADTFQTATQERPHRPARTPEQAAAHLTAEAIAGRLDPDCVAAVIEAAGQPRPRARREWPAGLSDREVEVLRLLARGLSNARDRRAAGDLPTHRRAPRPAHLHQDRPLHPCRRDHVRHGARLAQLSDELPDDPGHQVADACGARCARDPPAPALGRRGSRRVPLPWPA